jgi:hypothetical protein
MKLLALYSLALLLLIRWIWSQSLPQAWRVAIRRLEW